MYSGAMPLAICGSPERSPGDSRPWIDVGVALSGEVVGNGYPPHLPLQDSLANKLLTDLWSSCPLLPPSVQTKVAGAEVFGDGQGPGAVVPWWDLVFPHQGKSFSEPPRGDSFWPICATPGGPHGWLLRCLLLRGGVQKLAVLDWIGYTSSLWWIQMRAFCRLSCSWICRGGWRVGVSEVRLLGVRHPRSCS